MRVGLLGRKVGMTQIYQENGVVVPVTVLECGPCTVLQVRTEDRDGYHAWQLGFDDKKRKKANQAERGHARKVSGEPKRFVREVRQDGPTEISEGQTLKVDLFNAISHVDVTGDQQGPWLCGRHEAARVPRPAGHATASSECTGTRARPAPAPTLRAPRKGIRKPGHMGNVAGHGPQPRGRASRPRQQPALDQRGRPRPQRRLYHHPADQQGLEPELRPSDTGPARSSRPANRQMDRTMLTVPVYSPAGERIGEETIDPADFGGEINKQLLHEVVLMHLAARRVGTVNTRGRADVAGSGKKLFRQKGTGNARVGPKRTNKRKGGGVGLRQAQPRLPLLHAEKGRPHRHSHGASFQISRPSGDRARRPEL